MVATEERKIQARKNAAHKQEEEAKQARGKEGK
jgi:hypothetical protein